MTNHSHLYAQKDVILNSRSLDKQLSEMNVDWKQQLSSARTYRAMSLAALVTQIAALGICLAQNNTANVVGWCAGSVGMGFVTYPLAAKADALEYGVIHGYNQTAKTAPEAR